MFWKKKKHDREPLILDCGFTIDTCPVLQHELCPRYSIYECPKINYTVKVLQDRVNEMSKNTLKKQCEAIIEEQNFE